MRTINDSECVLFTTRNISYERKAVRTVRNSVFNLQIEQRGISFCDDLTVGKLYRCEWSVTTKSATTNVACASREEDDVVGQMVPPRSVK